MLLVLCQDDRVRYGMRGYVAWCFYLLVKVYIVILIMQRILKPPESTVDRVLFSSFLLSVPPLVPAAGRVRFSKLSTPYQAHTVQRGRDEGPMAMD